VTRRLDWEKARRRELVAHDPIGKRERKKRSQERRQRALADFVSRHEISCFKCGKDKAEWATCGTSKRGPWTICIKCVKRKEARLDD
jgi:hypothetical protein